MLAPILTAVAQAGGGRGGAARATAELEEQVAGAQRRSLLVSLGTLLSTAALVLGLLALSAAYTGASDTTSVPWIVTLMAAAAAMGLLCVVQLRLWNLSWRRWLEGIATDRVERTSKVLHGVSYVVVVVGILAGIAASHDVGFAGGVSNWATLALVPLIAAQVLGGANFVRRDGPPGTVPTHLRHLFARIERARHED